MRGDVGVEQGRSAVETINSVAELATEVHRILLRHERKIGVSIKRVRLAKIIGVSASSLYAYLNGTTLPPADIFDRLLDALDVSTDDRRWLATARDELTMAGRGAERRPAADVLPAARWQLPMDIAEFTGRAEELDYLGALADSAGGTDTATTVAVIQGMPGVGKTRLAVRAAHQLAGRFADIQLWVDLRGFDPDRAPADPADVLAQFLRMLGVADEQVPPDPDARAALYRDRLHGRNALVLLDNAASEAQVRPLLPGSPTCMVLVTSRCGLPGIDGAHPVRLDVLPAVEAVDLLARIVGRGRVPAEPAAAVAIAELCGCLPIAITVLARLLQARPAWTLAHLAARLADADQRLARLAVGDRDITGAFSLSYRFLRADLRQLFRLLSLHPGDDFTPEAAAALVNVATQTAERSLDELLDQHLLQQATPGRYRFHDLLRAYARDRADRDESAAGRLAAVRRLLGWYLSAADAAQRTLSPSTEPVPPVEVDGPGPPAFATPTHGLDWCRVEHDNLLAASRVAVDHGLHDLAWRIPVALKVYLEYTRPWNDWLALGEIAVTSARRAEDQYGEVRALNVLGNAYWELRRFGESRQTQELALAINREIGQRHAEGTCLNNIGACYQAVGDFTRAISYYRRALTIALEVDGPGRRNAAMMSRGVALMSLGESHHGLGRFREAVDYYTQSLEILRQNGNRYHESFALTYLGHTCAALGQWDAARSWYEQALTMHDTMKNRYGEAETLIGFAAVLSHEDRVAEANRTRSQAAAILDELNAPSSDKLRTRILGC